MSLPALDKVQVEWSGSMASMPLVSEEQRLTNPNQAGIPVSSSPLSSEMEIMGKRILE